MTFNTPNVYIQEQSGLLPPSISNADTIPAFIGYTESGPLNTPTRITSLSEYEATFGGARNEEGLQVTVQDTEDSQTVMVKGYSTSLYDSLYHSVQMFFANGGGACYIVSVSIQSSSQTRLIADDGTTNDRFGDAVAIANGGDRLLIASRQNTGGPGRAYIFERQSDGVSWSQVQQLAPTGTPIAFAESIALSQDGTTALIGDPTSIGGVAYVYVRQLDGSWSEEDQITPATANRVGDAVALSSDGNTALIGDLNGEQVFIYERENGVWFETAKLSSDDPNDDGFARALAISGDGNTAVISASSYDLSPFSNEGAVYIFERQSDGVSWAEVAMFIGEQEQLSLGTSVTISDATVLAGSAPSGGVGVTEEVYIYQRELDGSWSKQATLRPSDVAADEDNSFGRSVALCGDIAVIGATADDEQTNSAGAVYLFKRQINNTIWIEIDKITATDGQAFDSLGSGVAIFGNTVIGGASGADGLANDSGAAYIFGLEGPTLSHYQTALDTLDDEDGPTLLVFPNAANDLCGDDLYTLYKAALAQAGALKDRFVIMDTADNLNDAGDRFREGIGDSNLDYGAVYYPHVQTTLPFEYADGTVTISHVQSDGVTASTYDGYSLATLQGANDLIYNQVKLKLDGLGVTMPASGAMAGVYARTDDERGVWKAPANTTLANVSGPTVKLSDAEQASFNVDETTGKSINVIRSFDGGGTLVWGGRTLDGNDHDWRYISTKRLLIQIEKDLQVLTTAAIGEANIARNWTKLKGLIESYLMDLWQRGGLVGSSAEEAYFIGLGAGETMTEVDVANGILKITLGVAATRPAEFVIITFTQKL